MAIVCRHIAGALAYATVRHALPKFRLDRSIVSALSDSCNQAAPLTDQWLKEIAQHSRVCA